MVLVGLDIGKTKIGVILEDEEGELSNPEFFSSSDYWSQKGLEEVIEEFLDLKNKDSSAVDGIGIAVPGVGDTERKVVEKDIGFQHRLSEAGKNLSDLKFRSLTKEM